jgi:ADP-ribose pyrophosphatase
MIKTLFNKYGFRVELTPFTVNGRKEEYLRIVGPDVVVTLVIDKGRILLEKQYRHALKEHIYELPAGVVDDGERPDAAARRELEEETGYAPVRIRKMFKAYEAPGRIKSMFHFYLVEGVRKGRKKLDPTEIISSRWVSMRKFDSMIRKNEIIDLKTIALYSYYRNYVNKPK